MKPHLVIVGSSDVDRRIGLLQLLTDQLRITALGSRVELAPAFRQAGIDYEHYQYDPSFSLLSDLSSLRAVLRILRRLKPDIVHSFDTRPCVFARLAARSARVPVTIGTLPGLGGLWARHDWQARRRRCLIRLLHKVASACSTVTVFQNEEDRAQLDREGAVPLSSSLVIPGSGVDGRVFDPSAVGSADCSRLRSSLGIAAQAPVLLYVGRLLQSKGVGELAAAATALRAASPALECVLVGEAVPHRQGGLDEAEWRRVGECCRWLGPRDDIPELLAMASLFVYPSWYREGVPRALVEAALMSKPIVCTNTVGCREVVQHQHTGVLVPCHDPMRLAEACSGLLRRPEHAAELGVAARRRSLAAHELTIIAAQHHRLYERLLGMECAHG